MIPKIKLTNGPGAVIDGKETPLKLEEPRKAIKEKTLELLQEQIRHELFAERLYYSIAAWADYKGFPETAKFFSTHAHEEHEHAMSFVNFILKRGEHAKFPDTELPVQEFDSMMDAIDYALEHEYFITERIQNIFAMAQEEGDYLALEQARKFIKEQIEEEQLFLSLKHWLEVNKEPGPDWEIEVMRIHNKEAHFIGTI
jgi:ferritin